CQNCESDELTKTIKLLYAASSKFFKDKKVKQGFKGALRCLEVSYNRTNCNYHPHLHCLIAVKKSYFTSRYYLNREKISEIWKKCLNSEYFPQVWITKCDDNALAEVVKYAVKPLELTTSDVVRLSVLKTLYYGLHGRRLLQTYGIIKEVAKQLNIDLNEEDSDCVSNSDSDEIKTYIFNFNTLKYEQNNF
ncbi:MAG: protein rep, partial [Spirochaetales bacterium]|nr:protein rep [Spirochaetales bacterium]